ncbi:MAG: PTS sugar transporter subunit IIA [Candidatus Omnitrophica bacterium]|nr:PTS sugar transporter subunit IIA [Candidatus Omnitrophota bacterium]
MVNISQYLKKERIILDLKAGSKKEVVAKLAEVLRDQSEIIDFDGFLNDVFERENLGTTGIGLGLALPHARSQAVKSFVIVIGRVDQGMDFNSLDTEPVKLIFLMGTPKEEVQGYLKILAHLTRLLKKEAFRASLLQVSSPQELIEVFKKEESASS